MTAAEFRAAWPEFTDATKYTDAAIARCLSVAEMQVSATRWGEMRTWVVGLHTAHNLTLAYENMGNPGGEGVISQEKVGGLSVSYDTSGWEKDAGQWNRSIYGEQFIRYSRMIGAGGVCV